MTKAKAVSLYTGFKIFEDLKPKQRCFRLRQYKERLFVDGFPEHIPRRRISADNAIEMMKALVLRYEGYEAPYILTCYLNSRGKEPAARSLQFHVDYPEPGVIRRHCSSNNITVWMDEVIVPAKFRR